MPQTNGTSRFASSHRVFLSPLIVFALVFSWVFFSALESPFRLAAKEARADIITGLIGHWKFDEGSGTVAADSSGSGNNGTLVNGPTWVPGKIGQALDLDGIDDYVDIPGVIRNSYPWSISLWFKPGSFTFGRLFGSSSTNNSTGEHSIAAGGSNSVRYFSATAPFGPGCCGTNATATNSVQLNEWNHVVAIGLSATDRRIILNADFVNQGTDTANVPMATPQDRNRIGSRPANNSFFDGPIDEVRIYNRALTQAEVTELFNQGTAPADPTQLAVTSVNGGVNPTAGTGFPVTVQAQDSTGTAANVTANTAITLSLNTGTGTLGGTLTGTILAGTNQVTISGVTYTKAESGVVLTATATSGDVLTAGNSAAFTVDPGAATNLVFTTQPGGAAAGSTIPGPPTVEVRDSSGNLVSSSTASITIAIGTNPGAGTLSGTTTKAATAGVASFSDLSIDQVGTGYTLTVSSTGFTGATSAVFDITGGGGGGTGTIAGTVTRSSDASAISGALVEALQASVVQGFDTTAADGSYSIPNLAAGTYDVRASAGGFVTQTQNGIAVTGGVTTTVNFSLAASTATGGIVYIYDDLGRLKAVVDPATDTGVYEYDAVGNLLSISRQASSAASVIEFRPKSGPVGTTVTIFGTGFSTTLSDNSVDFNGALATVISSTETEIVVSVPSGATTGPITVTTPTGSSTSSEVFTVTASTGAPTITGFNPTIGTPGTPVTITGTNFETTPANNKVRFNISHATVNSSTSTTINTSVPTGTGSGRIRVATPLGAALSSEDFFIPPAGFTAADVEFTGRMTVDGPSLTATIGTAGKIGLVVFDGMVGQPVSLGVNSSSISGLSNIQVFNPDGTSLAFDGTLNTGTNFHMTLPAAGTYTILIDPDSTSTGNVTLTLSSEVNGGTIVADGASVTVSISRVGQRARLTFDGTAGQLVSLGIDASSLSGLSDIWVFKPDGTTLASDGTLNTGTNFHMTLPAAGTYTILIDPDSTSTGNVTLTLSGEVLGSITINGPSVTTTISRVGQRARLTFDGTAGQLVSLGIDASSLSGLSDIWVFKPDGTTLASDGTLNTGTNFHMTLPAAGTYTILIDPDSTSTGDITLTLTSP